MNMEVPSDPMHEFWMKHCLELALKGKGLVAPNPMVGCAIVHDGKLIGEGFHNEFGGAHAEVAAIHSVADRSLLKSSVMYVSLEPCTHLGKTPPCVDLILEHKIPYVVIGCIDPNPLVSGSGIEKLIRGKADVKVGVLELECRELNRRFFTFQEKKRPYIILKWARSADGFIDRKRSMAEIGNQERITCNESNKLVHQWRSEEQAIMVGTTTALLDNPSLTVRHVEGRNPLRVVIDKELKIPDHYRLFDKTSKTLVFTGSEHTSEKNVEYVSLDFANNVMKQITDTLYKLNVSSIIIEGGRELVNGFINEGLWDEARVFTAPHKLGSGVKGPNVNKEPVSSERIGLDNLGIYMNT